MVILWTKVVLVVVGMDAMKMDFLMESQDDCSFSKSGH